MRFFLTRKGKIEKFGNFRGKFPNPYPNQRWLTRPELSNKKLTQPNPGQKILTQTHQLLLNLLLAILTTPSHFHPLNWHKKKLILFWKWWLPHRDGIASSCIERCPSKIPLWMPSRIKAHFVSLWINFSLMSCLQLPTLLAFSPVKAFKEW